MALVALSLVAGWGPAPAPAAAQLVGAPHAQAYTEPPTSAPVSPAAAARWREDLAQLARELVERHGDAFHSLPAPAYRASVEALAERIPALARHQIVVGMMRLVAAIGDGHTSVPVLFDPAAGFHALPLRLGSFEEGLFVEAGEPALREAIGARVLAVGGLPTEEAIERVAPLISRDNDIWLRTMAPLYLAVTEILHAVGLSDDPLAATLDLERDGRRWTLTIPAQPEPFRIEHGPQESAPEGWVDARGTSAATPALRWRQPGRAYWSEYLAEHRTLYIQYDRVNDAPHGPGVHAFFDQALATADRQQVERLILDIRENSGGEGGLNVGVVKRILLRRELDRPGRLFVVIGRQTFSAAQVLAHELERWTAAIFIGEPTGSSPQFYGDHSFFRLAHSGLLVSAAPTWWQPGGPYDRRPYLPPRLAFEPRFEDYVAGRDPAVEAVLAWDERPTLGDLVLASLATGDSVAAEAAARAWSRDPVHRYVRATDELNRLGYRLLREGRTDEALAVFRLNVRVHPEYANGWDSLGETLLAVGRREAGLAAYRRAYELDPRVGRAAEVLGRERP